MTRHIPCDSGHSPHRRGKQILSGILSCDCFLAYDALPCRQHKCTGHLLRRCAEMHADKTGAVAVLSQRVARLLRGAMTLRERREPLGEERYQRACPKLEAALDRLLEAEQTGPDKARLVKLLRKHRGQLFTFLYVEGLAPTNDAAEREIRPAVVARKTSGAVGATGGPKRMRC